MGNWRLSLSSVVALLLHGLQAWAESTAVSPGNKGNQKFRWNSASYEECSQTCLYKKANENLILQFVYIVKKVQAVEDESDKRIALGDFCLEDETGDGCHERYRLSQKKALHEIRKAIIQNWESEALLRQLNPEVLTDLPKSGSDQKLKKQLPEVVTLEDLKKNSSVDLVQDREYEEWKKTLKQFRPSKDEFVKFKKILRDPTDPSKGEIAIPDRGQNGELVSNEEELKEAEKRYQAQRADAESAWSRMEPKTVKPIGMTASRRFRKWNADAVSEQAFEDSRQLLVDLINDKIKGDGKKKGVKDRISDKNQGIRKAGQVQERLPGVGTGLFIDPDTPKALFDLIESL